MPASSERGSSSVEPAPDASAPGPRSRAGAAKRKAPARGGAYLPSFERLLRAWQQRGTRLADLATYAGQLDFTSLPRCSIVAGTVEGRSGRLALQSQWKK